jgi:defect-in-organelle-trafficking protein DotD
MQGAAPNQYLQVMMNSRSLLLLSFVGLAILAGCQNPTVTPVATEPDIVTVKLAQAADKASNALDSIAGIEQQRSPATPPLEDYTGAPPNLMQPVSIRWSGGIEPVTKTLAERAGLRFRVKGNVPPIPLTVNVDAYQQPILHVLHDIGLQAGHRADLAVDGASGVVELRYAPSDLPESHHADETK